MNSKTLAMLEFDKIRELLKNEAVGIFGRRKAEELTPLCALSDAQKLADELSEAIAFYIKRPIPAIGEAGDISGAIRRAEAGGVLSTAELLGVAQVLRTARTLISYYKEDRAKPRLIDFYFDSLTADRKTEEAIFGAIISEDEIADSASPTLASIRRQIANTHAKIREHLNNMIHSRKYQKYLQESIITLRDGRYVVPVKAEHKSEVGGIVHDMSSTGATLFIEPNAVVEGNNALRELEVKESAEIERILSELTVLVSQITHSLFVNQKIIGEIDFLFAKARLAVKTDAVVPKLNGEGIISIVKGRHPLLDPKTVVPITVSLGKGYKTLVITGPNTGGKTVSLKTIGLFCLMAAAGLAVPAEEGTELCVFDSVFADIGDEQSIEQSLSTFSSHMTNIVSILGEITSNSLVLMDELGAGTDPTEGAALAVAILKHIKSVGATTVATTHYSEIKLYALTTDGVENASCEFDVNSLRPTYRLLTGIPGKSNAFAISKRLGLPDYVIDEAQRHLTEETIRFEDVISDLERSRAEAEAEQQAANRYRQEAERLKTEIESEKEKIDEAKQKLSENARREARRIIEEAKREAEEIIEEIKKAQKLKEAKEINKAINEAKRRLNEKLKETDRVVTSKRKVTGNAPLNLIAGNTVYLIDIEQKGTVISPPKSDGTVTVQVGILKINSHISNLRLVQDTEKESKMYSGQKSTGLRSLGMKSEIDLRGSTLDDALVVTEKYIDDAYLASLGTVTIIHGKGTGVLRKGIHDMLKHHPHVKSYRLGTFGEGEAGVTVVELKQ
ncbi:MAG: Endonuclease MutS2 [Firmicutes bacterium ADurb.Bin193]|nr:MAG: Endonuclease MutS2 [Firmicutes bacterium ADurb.Bin193]